MTDSKKQKIGFDFDRVLVNYPPLIPEIVIDKLYKNGLIPNKKCQNNENLKYRFPGNFERKVRILSHAPFLRMPIKKNLKSLMRIAETNDVDLYLISSRYSFLKQRTNALVEKHKISRYFKKLCFNFEDKQPHIFKNEVIKKEAIEKFIDDDLDLLLYLEKQNPNIKFYWLSKKGANIKLPDSIKIIKNVEEFRTKYL